MIKVIYLDLGKVIVNFDYGVAIREIMKVTPRPLPEVMSVLNDQTLLVDYETGKVSTLDFYQTISDRLNLDLPLEEFRQLWGNMFLPEPLLSEEFLKALKSRYRLILLSNTNEIHFEFVQQKYPILSHIEEHLLSYRVGSMKPEREIYQKAIEKAGVAPQEIFFTDDRIENVEAAQQEGIQAVQFYSEGQLRNEMKCRGILS